MKTRELDNEKLFLKWDQFRDTRNFIKNEILIKVWYKKYLILIQKLFKSFT